MTGYAVIQIEKKNYQGAFVFPEFPDFLGNFCFHSSIIKIEKIQGFLLLNQFFYFTGNPFYFTVKTKLKE